MRNMCSLLSINVSKIFQASYPRNNTVSKLDISWQHDNLMKHHSASMQEVS